MNAEKAWAFTFDKAGRWWNSSTEIDVVAFDSTGHDIIFGECKYTEKKMDIDIFYALLEKAKEVPWKNDSRREWYVLFSINGFTDEMIKLAGSRKDILLCD